MERVSPKKLSLHPEAGCVPEMADDEYAVFLDDIRTRGVRKPIELIPGTRTVIDGRTRLKAALQAGLKDVPVEDAALCDGESPKLYMLRTAALRRHLTTGQRAILAAEMEGLTHGGRRRAQDANLHLETVTRKEAAATAGVSTRTVATARMVLEQGTAKEIDDLRNGRVSVNKAASAIESRKPNKEAAVPKDMSGQEIPERLRPLFAERWRLWNLTQDVEDIVEAGVPDIIERLDKHGGPFDRLNRKAIDRAIGIARTSLATVHRLLLEGLPHSACGHCKGAGCRACKDSGYRTHAEVAE